MFSALTINSERFALCLCIVNSQSLVLVVTISRPNRTLVRITGNAKLVLLARLLVRLLTLASTLCYVPIAANTCSRPTRKPIATTATLARVMLTLWDTITNLRNLRTPQTIDI